MSPTHALLWFMTTTLGVFGMIVLGIYLAMHSYERGRGVIHLRHRRG